MLIVRMLSGAWAFIASIYYTSRYIRTLRFYGAPMRHMMQSCRWSGKKIAELLRAVKAIEQMGASSLTYDTLAVFAFVCAKLERRGLLQIHILTADEVEWLRKSNQPIVTIRIPDIAFSEEYTRDMYDQEVYETLLDAATWLSGYNAKTLRRRENCSQSRNPQACYAELLALLQKPTGLSAPSLEKFTHQEAAAQVTFEIDSYTVRGKRIPVNPFEPEAEAA